MNKHGILVLLLWLVIGGTALWLGGFAAWFLFFCIGLIGLSQLWLAIAPLSGITGIRQSATECTDGDEMIVSVSITLHRKRPLLWLSVEDQWHRKLFFPGFNKYWYYTYKVPLMQRGHFRSEHMIVKTGDLLGWWIREKQIPAALDVLVYPKEFSFSELALSKRVQIQTFLNRHISQSAIEPSGQLRDYRSGDRLSQVHWGVSASKPDWYTKVFDHEEMFERCLYLLDRSALSWSGEIKELLFEKAISITAGMFNYTAKCYTGGNPSDKRELYRSLAAASIEVNLAEEQQIETMLKQQDHEQTVIYVAARLHPNVVAKLRQTGLSLQRCLFVQIAERKIPSRNEREQVQPWLQGGGSWVYVGGMES